MPKDETLSPTKESNFWTEWLTKCGLPIPNSLLRGERGERRVTRSNKESANSASPKSRTSKKLSLPDLRKRKRDITPVSDSADMPVTVDSKKTELPPAYAEEVRRSAAKSQEAAIKLFEAQARVRDLNLDAQRQVLVDNEWSNSWQAPARASASLVEKEAAQIVYKVREHERYFHFGNMAGEAVPGKDTRDMGGSYLINKERIDMSSLFQIAKKMPKGTLLHLHMNAELQPEELIRQSQKLPGTFCVTSNMPLIDRDALETAEVQFSVVRDSDIWLPVEEIFKSSYAETFMKLRPKEQPTPQKIPVGFGAWVRWNDFSRHFKDTRYATDKKYVAKAEASGGKSTPAEYWALDKMVLGTDEVYDQTQTVNGIWARFNQGTRAFKGFFNYELAYRWYLAAAIDELIRDGIMYAEFRPMWLDKSIPNDFGTAPLDHAQQIRILKEICDDKHDALRKEGRLDDFPFYPKIIYCAPRSIPKEIMQTEIEDCIRLKQDPETTDFICGFDLVGAEDRANNIGHYLDQLVDMQQRCEAMNKPIPFMFHAGETLMDTGGSRDPGKSNLIDSVLLKAKRIGHGFSLMKHPGLVKRFKELPICIELCPISNELLHLCRSAKEHPYPEILEAGIPCTINSDNPSLFRNSMSHEFYQVMVGSPSMTLHGWKQLAQWSIQHSCLDKQDQERARSIFDRKWEAFCEWIVREANEGLLKKYVEPKSAKAPFLEKGQESQKKHYDALVGDLDLPDAFKSSTQWS